MDGEEERREMGYGWGGGLRDEEVTSFVCFCSCSFGRTLREVAEAVRESGARVIFP